MKYRAEAINYCLSLSGAYEDYPFRDKSWTVMRHKKNTKVFAWIFDKEGRIWINVKAEPGFLDLWRQTYPSVIPAFHLNKDHWNSIILDGSVPEDDIREMIRHSYAMTENHPIRKR